VRTKLLLLLSVALAAATVWLWTDNRRLTREVGRLTSGSATEPATEAAVLTADGEGDAEAAPGPAGSRRAPTERALALLGTVGKAMASPPPAEAPPRDAESRRDRRQQRLRELLGRAESETEEAYRARLAPMIEMALARPRQRVEERRAEFEAAAELTPEQRAGLDSALGDARADLVATISEAVTAGDLTPYRRNTAGVLRAVGAAAGVAEGFDARIRQSLTPEQAAILDQTGFDLIEYLGVTVPWETVTPPPPAATP
jgi:Spy/CpxP family protein refolding chaperone